MVVVVMVQQSLLHLGGGVRKPQGYWVEMRWTIMWMMREPRGQLHRSMLGLLILSSSSWSSSQRSIFTSSATWDKSKTLNLQRTRPSVSTFFNLHLFWSLLRWLKVIKCPLGVIIQNYCRWWGCQVMSEIPVEQLCGRRAKRAVIDVLCDR